MEKNEISKVYDTLLSVPGMEDTVRIDVKISRKLILLLDNAIELGVAAKGNESMIAFADKVSIEQLLELGRDCLEKANLINLKNKIADLKVK